MANESTMLTKLRKLFAALPNTSEGRHFGKIAFKVGKQMFATFGEGGGGVELVFALQPEHAAHLIDSDPRFERYPRAPHTVRVLAKDVTRWSPIERLLRESYALSAPPPAREQPGGRSKATKAKTGGSGSTGSPSTKAGGRKPGKRR